MNNSKINILDLTVTKLFSNCVFVFVTIMPFIMPAFIYIYDDKGIINCIKVIIGVISIFALLIKGKLSLGLISLTLFYISFIVTSIVNKSNITAAIIQFLNALVFSVLLTLCIKCNTEALCKVLTFVLLILWSGELTCLCLFPDGIMRGNYYYYKYGFINIDNQLAPVLIFSFLIIIYNLMKNKRQKLSIFCLIEMLISVFITWSATCVVVTFILVIYLIFFYNKKYENLLKAKLLLPIVLVLFFLIVIFRINDVLGSIIENILGKDLTLSGRTEIWDSALQQIQQCFLLGRGISFEQGWIFWKYKFYYTHNLFLEILLCGGILSLVLFVIFVYMNISNLDVHKNSRLSALINICIFAMGIACLTESYMGVVYFPALFVFAYNINNLSKDM